MLWKCIRYWGLQGCPDKCEPDDTCTNAPSVFVHCDIQVHHSNLLTECFTGTILCATWTLEFATHAKKLEILSMQERISNFHGQPKLSIVSVSLKVQWSNVVTTDCCIVCRSLDKLDLWPASWQLGFPHWPKVLVSVSILSNIITYTMHMVYFQFLLCHQCLFCLCWWVRCFNFHLAGQQFDPFNQSSATRGLPQPTEKLEER